MRSPIARLVNHCFTSRTSRTSRGLVYTPQVSIMICTSPTVRLVKHCFTTRTSCTGRTVEVECSVTNDMHVTIDPRPVQPVNHCFTTCMGRTSRMSRVKPFTSRICSTVLDKDGLLWTTSRQHEKCPLRKKEKY